MRLFEAVKANVTESQAAAYCGFTPNRSKMICCPFHNDKHPSMKVDKRYYCFGCGEHGDAIDFVAKYYGLALKEAAMKLADDFGIDYDRKIPASIEIKRAQIKQNQERLQKEQMVQRFPMTIRTLKEKFAIRGQIGYLGCEYLDGKLIRKDAVKVFQMVAD